MSRKLPSAGNNEHFDGQQQVNVPLNPLNPDALPLSSVGNRIPNGPAAFGGTTLLITPCVKRLLICSLLVLVVGMAIGLGYTCYSSKNKLEEKDEEIAFLKVQLANATGIEAFDLCKDKLQEKDEEIALLKKKLANPKAAAGVEAFDLSKNKLEEKEKEIALLKIQLANATAVGVEALDLEDNRWNTNDRHEHLSIFPNQLTVTSVTDDWTSVRAKYPVPNRRFGIFYFEVKIVQRGRGNICVGIAKKSMGLSDTPLSSKDYCYCQNGHFYIQGDDMKEKPTFFTGDIIGCGINFATRQIIFTKNGTRLDTSGLTVKPTDLAAGLYPSVSLGQARDVVRANFGHCPFRYDPANEHFADGTCDKER